MTVSPPTLAFAADGVECAVDLSVGHLAHLTFAVGGRRLAPLHRAAWVDDGTAGFPDGTPQNVRRLSGDFLCAPFGRNDVEPGPSHGWPANSPWRVVDSRPIAGGWRARLRLEATVVGASVEKILTLRHGHPFLYQEHVFSGGSGAVPVAHHTMVRITAGATLAFSPKRFAETLPEPLEPDPARGRFALKSPARTEDLTRFPLADGGTASLLAYPPADRIEDFVTLAEAPHEGLGCTLVTRKAERDVIVVLKHPSDLPVTMLWISNGGRDYAPWSGRHDGVLGIEDGRASGLGHLGSLAQNTLSRDGVTTALALDPEGSVSFRQVIGAIGLEDPSAAATGVAREAGHLVVTMDNGGMIRAPFDAAFLREARLPR